MILCVCECVSIKLHITAQFESCHPSHFVPLALIPSRDRSMILVTKTSDQTRQRGVCVYIYQIAHNRKESGPVIVGILYNTHRVCIFIKLHITGPAILVILCHSH